jgi:hypothetical protein
MILQIRFLFFKKRGCAMKGTHPHHLRSGIIKDSLV